MNSYLAFRPICINYGCNEPVVYSHKDASGNPRWRIHCSHCQKASYGGHPHRAGVTPYKTGKCSNVDGHLGFNCMIKWSKVPAWAKGMTEVDHIDGDSTNNDYSNLDELCPICHKLKGQLSGDYNNTRDTRANFSTKKFSTSKKSANRMFQELFEKFA